jgi:hypothetical protein
MRIHGVLYATIILLSLVAFILGIIVITGSNKSSDPYANSRDTKMIDAFVATSGEEKLLLLRLLQNQDAVDLFLIIDNAEAIRGESKPLLDLSGIPDQIRQKIIYHVVEFPPDLQVVGTISGGDGKGTDIGWSREWFQRDALIPLLKRYSNPWDVVFHSDLDEIPDITRIREYLENNKLTRSIVHYAARTYVFNVHSFLDKYKVGHIFSAPVRYLDDLSLSKIRTTNPCLATHSVANGDLPNASWDRGSRGLVVHLHAFLSPRGYWEKKKRMVEGSSIIDDGGYDLKRKRHHLIAILDRGNRDDIITLEPQVLPVLFNQVLHPLQTMTSKDTKDLKTYIETLDDSDFDVFYNRLFREEN